MQPAVRELLKSVTCFMGTVRRAPLCGVEVVQVVCTLLATHTPCDVIDTHELSWTSRAPIVDTRIIWTSSLGGGCRWWKGIVVDVEAVSREEAHCESLEQGEVHPATGRRPVYSQGRQRRRAIGVGDVVKEGEDMSCITSVRQVPEPDQLTSYHTKSHAWPDHAE